MATENTIGRRTLLKGALASGLATPFLARQAFASSGEIKVFSWGGYIQPNMIEAFEKKTGTTVNLSTYGSNEEANSKLRAAGGEGFDLIFPSVDNRPDYDDGNLLQEIDESRIDTDQVQTALWRNSLRLGASHRGKRYLVPFNWGTEGITYDSSVHDFEPGQVSYGDLWKDGLDGQVAVRQKSVLIAIALYLDATGELPSDRGMDLYKSEADTAPHL
ncbi:extracellular solute-binding protein [Roseovarius sp. M141]|uniref:extracellular solute-binding protein n=1 Tax=Roseovarius sp. M141 TaxID=2583806 RepID=UPI0020CD96E7|nr:extracellular solute-binding protein [Roseovarius sp. M141]